MRTGITQVLERYRRSFALVSPGQKGISPPYRAHRVETLR